LEYRYVFHPEIISNTNITIVIESKKKDGWFLVFNATFNNISVISWQSVLLVEETGVHGGNHSKKRKIFICFKM
jgi:hypothetical protein